MKIHQLPMGARFIYEGEELTKTGPLFAAGKNGQKLIPKYAVLKPIGDISAVPPPPVRDMLARSEVLSAFDTFYGECRAHFPEDKKTLIDAARDRFIRSLG